MTELEVAYERLHQAEDLLGEALSSLEGELISKQAVINNIKAYFEARKKR